MTRLNFRFWVSAAALIILCLMSPSLLPPHVRPQTTSSPSSPPSSTTPTVGVTPVNAGALEDLLAEGTDMLAGQAARDAADRQLRDAKKEKKNPESCPVFKCANDDQVPTPKRGHVPHSNGCGSYGFKIHSKWHEGCCDTHDKCFSTCGKSRNECDKDFKKCMSARCSEFTHRKDRKQKDDCEGQAQMFFTGTRALGCQAYLDSQQEACDCVRANELPPKKKSAGDSIPPDAMRGPKKPDGPPPPTNNNGRERPPKKEKRPSRKERGRKDEL